MIHVGYFSNQFASSKGHGIARYARHLYNALLHKNTSLVLHPISASTNGTLEEIDALKSRTGLTVLPWGRKVTPLSWMFFNFPFLENGVSNQIDIVHALSLGYKVATLKPYVVTIHDIGPLTHPQFFTKKDQWFMKGSLKQAVKKATAMICVSQATADAVEDYAVANYNQSVKERIHVVHEGVDSIFLKAPLVEEITDFHIAESLLNNPFVLTVGQISPRKNLQAVLEAFSTLKDEIPNLQLIAVGGNGWDIGKVEEQINTLGLKNRVYFLGYVSDELLRYLYRKALVFVYPSLFEGFGLTVLEAMASKCPVITSNNSSLPEIAGDAAILINPNDITELSTNILYVYNNPEKRAQMISDGFERAKFFSWDKAAKLTQKVYEKVIEKKNI
jgi:glycosyltransferase involved in cell wall biosynthesis